MPKEKQIEKDIVKYLKSTGGLVESMQGGKILVKKAGYNHMMTLNSTGCPDILFFKDKELFGIEVKKNQKAVDEWLKLYNRYHGIGKTLEGTKSYKREIGQIEYAENIKSNGGHFLVTCSLEEVKEFITNLGIGN